MNITYLGHAGFCIETPSTVIVTDPWLSKNGAFDAAWFQYPCNHHMADYVQTLFSTTSKEKYLYLSHEHHDHFDINFLKSLKNRDFTLLLANFFHPNIKNTLLKNDYVCKAIVSLNDEEKFHFKDGFLTLFLLDMELDCDSAILIKTHDKCFLNLNDCKIHERLETVAEKYGPVDVFTAQFSGAVWHPTCYKMSLHKYQQISSYKNYRKLELTAKAIEVLKPSFFIPSAGPACFLDPHLLPINFEKINIFQHVPKLFSFLTHRFQKQSLPTQWNEMMPGDQFDLTHYKFTYTSNRVKESEFKDYILTYAQRYQQFFEERARQHARINPQQVFHDLKPNLLTKLARMKSVIKNIPVLLYWSISDFPGFFYRIDFQNNSIQITQQIDCSQSFFSISSPGWQVHKVLCGELSWSEFTLCFRMSLERHPDIYNTLIQGFLTLEGDSLERFCHLFTAIFTKQERILVQHHGKTYSVLRYCPHQGGDLLHGWIEDCFLVCPRHQWKFNLEQGGECKHNAVSIQAFRVDESTQKGGE